ncbi:unnamed protein product, partial [Nesidiocoris tenuis]
MFLQAKMKCRRELEESRSGSVPFVLWQVETFKTRTTGAASVEEARTKRRMMKKCCRGLQRVAKHPKKLKTP